MFWITLIRCLVHFMTVRTLFYPNSLIFLCLYLDHTNHFLYPGISENFSLVISTNLVLIVSNCFVCQLRNLILVRAPISCLLLKKKIWLCWEGFHKKDLCFNNVKHFTKALLIFFVVERNPEQSITTKNIKNTTRYGS